MTQHNPNILVRLPNWLGDVIMSVYFLNELHSTYPTHAIHVIAKKGLEPVIEPLSFIRQIHTYDKGAYGGLLGLRKFGLELKKTTRFDYFFCLPNSFSSAWMGFFSGAKHKIGYATEGRSFLLTKRIQPHEEHRVLTYLRLLGEEKTIAPQDNFKAILDDYNDFKQSSLIQSQSDSKIILVNFNSEAFSRTMPVGKAAEIISDLSSNGKSTFYLSGTGKDESYVNSIIEKSIEKGALKEHLVSLAGKTSLEELLSVIKSVDSVLTVDSGIAHVANLLGKKTVVLFGAGDENSTSPFLKKDLSILRVQDLACAPCVSNSCIYDSPKCLLQLQNEILITKLLESE